MMKFRENKEEMLCYCIGVPKQTVIDAIKAGYTTLKEIKAETAACTGNECAIKNPSGKCCSREIKALIILHSSRTDTSSCDC